jgi:hypothetical protein
MSSGGQSNAGVDVVVNPAVPLPLAPDIAGAIVTSSAFEHDVGFWDTFLEPTRILRPGGLGGPPRHPARTHR